MKTKQKTKSGNYLIGKIQNLYCSCQSEVSAFLFFNYYSIIFKNTNKNLSKAFFNFSIVSLQNSRILADILLKFNKSPLYENSQQMPLSSLWICYEKNNKEIIETTKKFIKKLLDKYDDCLKLCKSKILSNKINNIRNKNQKILNIIESISL